jgi:hypothetical protein
LDIFPDYADNILDKGVALCDTSSMTTTQTTNESGTMNTEANQSLVWITVKTKTESNDPYIYSATATLHWYGNADEFWYCGNEGETRRQVARKARKMAAYAYGV